MRRNRAGESAGALRSGRTWDVAVFRQRLETAWARAGFFRPGDRVLIAVSGGPDSVALLALLHGLAPRWKLQLRVLHVNYGLRGIESDGDADFVARLCAQRGIECVCECVALAVRRGRAAGSLQEQARSTRYALLQREAERWRADRIAIGHTANDQAETVLLWMLRGAGGTGLAGIPPMRGALYVRPLLEVPRDDILRFLRAEGLAYRMDSSNDRMSYLRNRVRHEVLPVLQRLNPAVVDTLSRQAEVMRAEDACLEEFTGAQRQRLSRVEPDGSLAVERSGLVALPLALQRRLIRMVLRGMGDGFRGSSFRVVTALLDRVVHGRSGSALTVRSGTVRREYDVIRFVPHSREEADGRWLGGTCPHQDEVLPVVDWAPITWRALDQTLCFSLNEMSREAGGCEKTTQPTCAWFDPDRFTLPLVVRAWRPGDVLHPRGMRGRSKKVQDVFVDARVPRALRCRIPLLVAPEGILWVVGVRADERFRVGPETRRVLKVEIKHSGR